MRLWRQSARLVAHGNDGLGLVGVDPPSGNRCTAGVGVQPSAVTQEDRGDVQMDLVDQAALEKLLTDGDRQHLEVLAACGLERDPDRLGDITGRNVTPSAGSTSSG